MQELQLMDSMAHVVKKFYQLGVSDGQQSLLYRRHGAVIVIICGDCPEMLPGLRHQISRACTAH